MPKVKIYHNPRCTKSRQTLQLLRDQDIEPEVIEYLKTPPTTKELKNILNYLNITPRDLLRTKESVFKTLQLDNPELTNNDIIQAMVDNPILIERPIVVANHKAAIGRPPENILGIL